MTPALAVLEPGLCTTVQDLGRVGWQAQGVPVSGALDRDALRLANHLVGNPPQTAGLEILVSGPRLEIAADSVRMALAGHGAGIAVEDDGPARRLPPWQSVTLGRGAVLQIVLGRQSACCCLAVEGGIAVPPVLGSASTYLRARIGGYEGRALRRGDRVPLALERASERPEMRLPSPPPEAGDRPIRVVLGPQQEYFAGEAIEALLGAEFRISHDADRMGMRLDGPKLRHRDGWDIVSDAIPTGAIQVPGSGRAILLLADHQTTGGYPKIATLASADLPIIGRRGPGDPVRFAAVGVEEAERLARDAEAAFASLVATLEPVPRTPAIDLTRLYAGNLISGVVSASE